MFSRHFDLVKMRSRLQRNKLFPTLPKSEAATPGRVPSQLKGSAMPHLSKSLSRFQPSPISEVFALALKLQAEGRDLVNLSIGEPDFDTHESVCREAHAAIDRGETRYTAVDGTSELKDAIRAKFERDNDLEFTREEIVVDSGAKPLLGHIMLTLLDAGDEVVIPTPCWTSHPGMVRVCGAEPVLIECKEEDWFKLQPEQLANSLSSKTKALILCSPGNPTGAVYDIDQLRALADVLRAHEDIWIISDDIYEKLVFDGRAFATMAQAAPDLRERVITVNGVSKGYSMTGWRIGYAAGPREVMAGMRKVMSQFTGSPSSISQAAAVAALNGPQDYVADRRNTFQQRRDLVVRALNQTPGLRVSPCEGAFYLFISCAGLIGKSAPAGGEIASSTDLARYLLETEAVALVPGAAFECDPYLRLSFAASTEELEEACRRIRRACSELT
jgi:aspartate aminotransferase